MEAEAEGKRKTFVSTSLIFGQKSPNSGNQPRSKSENDLNDIFCVLESLILPGNGQKWPRV